MALDSITKSNVKQTLSKDFFEVWLVQWIDWQDSYLDFEGARMSLD